MSSVKETPAERIAFALSGLSRLGSFNVTPDFSPPAPDENLTAQQRRAGYTSTNTVYQYDPKKAATEYNVSPQTHNHANDLNRYMKRALELRDERKGTPAVSQHTVAPDA